MGKIVVIGSFVMDMLAKLDSFPQNGQTIVGKSLQVLPGGKGANQAVSAARQGAKVEMLGAVGADAYGDQFISALSAEGIGIGGVQRAPKAPTAVGMIMLDASGENRIAVIPGANHSYDAGHLESARGIIEGACLAMLQLELTPGVTAAALAMCNALGVPVMLDPAPAAPLGGEVFRTVTYFTPNETELAFYAGFPVDTDDAAKRAVGALLEKGVQSVVATLGGRGAMVGDKAGIRLIPAYPAKPVDTVGAGDSFNGALAARLAEGDSLDDGVRWANAAGAISVTKSGGIPSMPDARQTREFMEAHR